MSSTMLKEPKMKQDRLIDPVRLPAPAAAPSPAPVLGPAGKPAIPALLVDRVTKRFNVSRKK
jgi:hypothetical protein